MLGVGLQVGSADIRSTLASRSLLVRSLVVNFVLVPALGILIVRLVPMPSDTAAGFLLLALAPGGMSALQFTSRSKGALLYAGALSFILSLLSVFVSPAIAGLLLPTKSSVPFPRLIAILLLFVLLPLVVGMGVRQKSPKLSEKLAKPTATHRHDLVHRVRASHDGHTQERHRFARICRHRRDARVHRRRDGDRLGPRRAGQGDPQSAGGGLEHAQRRAVLLIASRDFPGTNVDAAVVAFGALMVPPNMLFALYSAIGVDATSAATAAQRQARD